MRCDGVRIIYEGAHGVNPWHMRPPYEGGRQGRGIANHIYGVLPQCVKGGEVPSAEVSGGSS